MDIKSRLKENPVLRNWKFTAAYLLTAAAGAAVIGSLVRPLSGVLFISAAVIFYLFFPVLHMLSVNYTINNHRLTLGFYAYCVALFSLPAGQILFVNAMDYFPLIFLIPVDITILAALSIGIAKMEKSRAPLYSYPVMTASFTLFLYLLISYLLSSFVITLAVLGAGALLSLVFLIIGLSGRTGNKIADIGILKVRFEAYLDTVLKRVLPDENNAALREQLYGNLINFAEKALESGERRENKIYRDAVDSLGDYSDLIKDRKKNPVARFAKISNFTARVFLTAAAEAAIILFSVLGSAQNNWDDAQTIFVFIPLIAITALMFLRVINNFKTKSHKLTSLLIGGGLFIIFFILSLVVYLVVKELTPAVIVLRVLTGLSLVSAVGLEILVRKSYKKKEKD